MSTTQEIITGVDFVSIPTGDLEAAVEFYDKTLGSSGRSTGWAWGS